MKGIMVLSVLTVLTACSSGGDGNGDNALADDSVQDNTAGDGAMVNENGGVTASSSDGPIDVVINNTDDVSDEVVTPELIQARQTIIGNWVSIEQAAQCTSTITFDDNRQFESSSLDEATSGTYRVSYDDFFESLELSLVYRDDNGLSNCYGDSYDSTGDFQDIYVTFPTPDSMLFSDSPVGAGNVVSFTRQN